MALILAALASPAALADTLIDNVDGMTLTKDGEVQRFTGIWIDDDGRVKQLLERGEKRPKDVTYGFDGKGRVLIPGFVDAHAHVMGLGFGALTLDLTAANSLAEAQAMIAAYAAKFPGKPWILGRGWNQEKWGLGRFPTAADLDAVVADRPVWLERVDGHAGWANSLAMQAAGVDSKSRAPEGGAIERINGAPSGIFVDKATALIEVAVPRPRAVDSDAALAEAQAILLRHGVTTVTDMGTTLADWQAFRRAGDLGQLKIRIISYASEIDDMATIGGPGPTPWLYDDRLRMVGVKLYLDGALGSRGAWLQQPYADKPGEYGLPLLSPAQLRNKMTRAAMDGFQPAVHAIGDAANREALDAIAELAPVFGGDRRWRIEHAQIVDPTDLVRFGALKVVASVQPVHQTSDRIMAEARLGLDRLGGAYAWNSLRQGAASLAFGTDAPVESAAPFPGWAAAISREDAAGQPAGGWLPAERIDRLTAWRAYTLGAAHAGFAEDRLGSLEPGKRADFLLLAEDPLLASPRDLGKFVVLESWIAGQPVYRRDQ